MFAWIGAMWQSSASADLVITKKIFASLEKAYRSTLPAEKTKFNDTMEALVQQAQANFSLFMHNVSALESFHPLHVNIASAYLVPKLLALSAQEPIQYNACIKRLITNGIINGPLSTTLKKQWLLNALEAKNKEIVLWLFAEGGLSLKDAIVSEPLPYPLMIYLANNLDNTMLTFLFNLKYANQQCLVMPADLDYEVPAKHFDQALVHTALERAITMGWGRRNANDGDLMTAYLLRQQGATNFGTLSLGVKEAFLMWEQQYNKSYIIPEVPKESMNFEIAVNQHPLENLLKPESVNMKKEKI